MNMEALKLKGPAHLTSEIKDKSAGRAHKKTPFF